MKNIIAPTKAYDPPEHPGRAKPCRYIPKEKGGEISTQYIMSYAFLGVGIFPAGDVGILAKFLCCPGRAGRRTEDCRQRNPGTVRLNPRHLFHYC